MKTNRSIISIYNLFYLFICIVWGPLQIYYLHVDGAGRTIMVLTIVAILLNMFNLREKKRFFSSHAFLCWIILVFYSFINSMMKGFVSENGTFMFICGNFLYPLVYLVVAIIELDNDKKRCLYFILFAQLVYLLIGATHIVNIQFERGGAEELGNSLPLMAMCCVFVVSVMFCERQLKWGWVVYVAIVAFAVFIVIACATRKALGGVTIVLVGAMLGRNEKPSIKSFFFIAIVVALLYIGLDWVLDNTLMGERLAESSEKYDVPLSKNPKVNEFLMMVLGDRAIQYQVGTELFHQHPITGIGLTNFMYVAHFDVRLHTEYMVQLCENGIVGFVLLIVFYFKLLKGLKRLRKTGKNTMVYLFGLLMVLFINLTAWTYNMRMIMLLYGVLIVMIYSKQDYKETNVLEQ